MGTNYYLKHKKCECCGLRDEEKTMHIGKSSYGWSFSFHGIPEEIENERDWKNVINLYSDTMEIVNEYEDVINDDDFWSLVESKRDGKNHTLYCRDESTSRRHGYEDCWIDEKTGSSFSKGEFS